MSRWPDRRGVNVLLPGVFKPLLHILITDQPSEVVSLQASGVMTGLAKGPPETTMQFKLVKGSGMKKSFKYKFVSTSQI